MKLGELYDLAKQAYPALTKRMFTQFYNQALQEISEQVRLSVVEEDYTDDSYGKIAVSEVVRIENITTEESSYVWKVVNDAIVFYDENEDLIIPDSTSIRYWERVVDKMNMPEIYTHTSDGTISSASSETGGALLMSEEADVDKYLVLLEPLISSTVTDELKGPDELAGVGDIIMIPTGEASIYVCDPTNLNVYTSASDWGANDHIDYYLLSNTWEEQTDGFADEVGLCAMYMATSLLTEFTNESPDTAKFSAQRAQQYLSRLRKKYNTSLSWTKFNQVAF